MHEAGRAARLHTDIPIFVQAASNEGRDGAVFGLLHPFQEGLLVDGNVPEDAWTRVARHWHECFRLRNPVAPGDPKMYGRRSWNELDHFIRQDNILQLRSIMSAVTARGRQWVPVRTMAPGSFIEFTDGDLGEIACAEHTRWYQRRLAAGWSAVISEGGTGTTAKSKTHSNASVVPWSRASGQQAGRAVRVPAISTSATRGRWVRGCCPARRSRGGGPLPAGWGRRGEEAEIRPAVDEALRRGRTLRRRWRLARP